MNVKLRYRILVLIMVLVLCLTMLTACGNNADLGQTNTIDVITNTPDIITSEPVSEVSSPTPYTNTNQIDLEEYLWEIPEDATLKEKVTLELRNASIIQAMQPLFEEESYSAYSRAIAKLRSKSEVERLDGALEARANLIQTTSVADGVYFIWNDFNSMPIADGEIYTEEELDASSFLGYGYTPILVKYLLDDPATAKGNILVISGGAMKGRSNSSEGYPAVEVFNELGYNCFLLQRRVEPYSTIDIYMDCQRAIRVIRYYAKQEEWGGQDMIAACGWSGGGATILGSIRKCFGYNTPTVYDSDYVPDEIDAVSSDLDAALIIYGAYNADGEGTYVGDNPNLPAFYINHGTGDDTIPYTNAQELYDLVSTRVPAKLTLVEGAPHGYGVGSEEFPDSSTWPTEADEFMQANLGQSQLYTVEEMSFYRDELEIYGQLIMPKGDGPFPLVIFAHGFGGNHTNSLSMAKRFAEAGVAAYTFDFCGGGRKSLSDGDTKDMSVLTEASDMNAVLDGLVVMPQIDASNIFAFGYSQGGFVSSYLAATRPGDIKALVAFFPAYVIHDDAKKNITDPENIPDEMQLMGMTIGRVYYEDALSFDIYDLLPNYTGDVLLLHGTKDPIVPIEYSERAVELFPSAELVIVEGGAHGNLGTDADDRAFSFVLEHID